MHPTSSAPSAVGTTHPVAQVAVDRPSTVRFDWIMIGLSLWLVGGLFLDGWAHHHLAESLETFLTPWHGVFYAGFLATLLVLVGTLVHNRPRLHDWPRAVPAGYAGSVVGASIFLVAGVGDAIWHTLFGIESNVEALISPPHLLIALGMALIVAGPARARQRRHQIGNPPSWRTTMPAVLSVTLVLALLTFFTQYAHPLVETWTMLAAPPPTPVPVAFRQELGMASILISSSLLAGAVLFLQRQHEQFPVGSLTLLVGSNAVGMSVFQDNYALIPGALVVGLIADLAAQLLQRVVAPHLTTRIVAMLVPTGIVISQFVTLALLGQLGWSIHLCGGAVVLALVVGWILSALSRPVALHRTSA
jgi:hypothetical protein